MAAFLSRFWLDAKNNDLSDELKEKEALIASTNDFEKEFRSVQKRLEIFALLTQNQDIASKNLNNFSTYLPLDVFIISYSQDSKGNISVVGYSPSEQSIAQLIVNLKSLKNIQNVDLTSISSNMENPTLSDFTLTITTFSKES